MKALVAAVALTFIALAASPAPAYADGGGVTISIPPAPIRAAPGETLHIPLRVSNNDSARGIHFSIAQRALSLGDNGQITVLAEADPAFSSLDLPADEQALEPLSYRDYEFELLVPPLAPDIYLIGLLVSVRNDTTSTVNVQGQLATFATLDVPGERDRRVQVALHLPGIHFGSSASGEAVLSNVGGSSFNVWGEVDSGGAQRTRITNTFLATGRQRAVAVSVSAKWGLGRKRVTLDIYHNISDSQTDVDTVTATVWLIHPAYIAGAVTILLAASLAAVKWLRRRYHARRLRRSDPTPWPEDRRDQSNVA